MNYFNIVARRSMYKRRCFVQKKEKKKKKEDNINGASMRPVPEGVQKDAAHPAGDLK